MRTICRSERGIFRELTGAINNVVAVADQRGARACVNRGAGVVSVVRRGAGGCIRGPATRRAAVVAWSLNQSRFVFPGPGPGPVAVVLGQALLGKNEHIQIRLADYCEVTYLPQKLHALSLAEAYVEQLELTRGKFPFN